MNSGMVIIVRMKNYFINDFEMGNPQPNPEGRHGKT